MKFINFLNEKKVFHSYKELKKYCNDVNNPLDNVELGKEIDSLHKLFYRSSRTNEQFAGIENWNVSKVKDMSCMFFKAKNFNQPIGNWDVSNVEDMAAMLRGASNFNQSLNNWNVSKVEYMRCMFFKAKNFNQPLNNWDVSNVDDMTGMFKKSELERTDNLPSWYKI